MEIEIAALAVPELVSQEKVAKYAQILDKLPPVTVFDLHDGLLLADGYHRVAAARQLGRTTIRAEVRRGSRRDALHFAAGMLAAQRGMTLDEALDIISRHSRRADRGGPAG